jgi:hypothetical protein
MGERLYRTIAALVIALGLTLVARGAAAQQAIGSTRIVQNEVTRELSGAAGPLSVGDSVFRDEVVRTGSDALAKLVFLDSTNLAVGPTSRVVLDRFVYEGDPNAEKVAINLAKGLFRFTTGNLDKKAYTITTPTAAIGVRGTVLDIDVLNADTRVTLVEGKALVCPRRKGKTFEQQAQNCGQAFGGPGHPRGGRCECVELNRAGQTASAKKVGATTAVTLSDNPVNFASLCGGDASICGGDTFQYSTLGGAMGGVLCGR